MRHTNRFAILISCALGFLLVGSISGSDEGLKPKAEYPAVSPDGTKLVFTSNVSGNRDLWISDFDGRNSAVLTQWPDSDEKQPDWSPDGGHIVFSSNGGSARYNIWVVNPDGTSPAQLTSDAADHEHPRFSPDGSMVVYVSNATGKKEIWVMKSDGSGQRSIALISSRISDVGWSPDGSKFVYVGCRRGGPCNLFSIAPNGSGGTQITSGAFQDWAPDWGPQGILFASDRGTSHGLWLVQPDGSGLHQLTSPDGAGDLDPRWIGKDKTGFVFARSGKGNTDAASDIWSVASAGATAQQITKLVTDTTPPVTTATASPGPNANGWNNTDVTITLNSTDNEPGGAGVKQITYSASGAQNIASTVVSGASTSFTINTEGITTITFFGTDNAGNVEPAKTLTVKLDKTPPGITASANPSTLWPPNGKMVPVTISGTITDNLSGVNPSTVTFAVQDKYGTVQPSGTVSVGANGAYSFTVLLEARRDGQDKEGRLYKIIVGAQDNAANPSSGSTTVVVPHDQGH